MTSSPRVNVSEYYEAFEYELWSDHPGHNPPYDLVVRAWRTELPADERVGQDYDDLDTAFDAAAEMTYRLPHGWRVEMLSSWIPGAGSGLMDHIRNTYGNDVGYLLGDAALWPQARPFLERYQAKTGWWPHDVDRSPALDKSLALGDSPAEVSRVQDTGMSL